MKKRINLFIALACVLALLIPALATSGNNALTLITAARKLGLETHNVSLKAQAEFSYDGEMFKRFTGEYRQDDINSYMYVSMDTPRADGTMYTGGFTVVGNGATAYSNDTYDGNYFVTHPTYENNTVLTGSKLLSVGMTTLEYIASALASPLDEVIKATPVDNGTRYDVNMKGAPDLVDSVLTYIAHNYISDNYYFDYSGTNYAQLEYEDYDALYAYYYRKVTGAEMPASFVAQAIEADYEDAVWELYVRVYDRLWDEAQAMRDLYDDGVVYLLADGTHKWYASVADYLRAAGIDYIYYDDYGKAFADYYETITGKPYTDELSMSVTNTSNMDLWEAYIEMTESMEQMYRQIAAQEPDAVAMRVHEDGTYTLLNKINSDDQDTLTRRVLRTFESVAVGDVNAAFVVDAQGNYVSGEGSASFIITDKKGAEHTLTITFDAQAYDYGTTEVKQFNKENYGFVTYEEYYEIAESGDPYEFDYDAYVDELKALPKTVEFNGVNYDTMIIVEGEG